MAGVLGLVAGLLVQLGCAYNLTPEDQRAFDDYRRSQRCCGGGGP